MFENIIRQLHLKTDLFVKDHNTVMLGEDHDKTRKQ